MSRVSKSVRRMVSIPFRSLLILRLPNELKSIKAQRMKRMSILICLTVVVQLLPSNHMSPFASKSNAISDCEHLRRSLKVILSQEN